ncbi:MAG: EamA family transporter [SAR86 cluster bacterium]|uniref:EamA family transporter n=1 Tax=SAR86 cluster bacterium TaxID=2030880 RepID=A0A937JA34_9GAMM|nr:EamA family transporter [SAR86 cluster bacterium]
MQLRYWFLLVLLGAIWGSSFMFIKIATPEFGPITLVGLRLLLAGSLFLPFLLMPKYLNQIKGHTKKILFLSLFNTAIPFTLFSYASLSSNSNMLAILNSSAALFTMIVAYFWINEQVSKKQILGLIIGFIGIVVLVNPFNAQTTLLASLACLLAALCYGISNVFIQKFATKVNKLVLIGWSLNIGGLIYLPYTISSFPIVAPSNEAFMSLIWLGAVGTGLAFIGYIRLIEKIGAVRTSTVAYFLPVFGIIWGNIFLNEQVTFVVVIGCFMVLTGIFVANTSKPSTKL